MPSRSRRAPPERAPASHRGRCRGSGPLRRRAMVRKQVGIVVYEEVEVLDVGGPLEVFSVTRWNEERRREELSPFNAFLVAETKSPVVATDGMKVVPEHDLDSCPPLDVLLVPGGWGYRHRMTNERLLHWIAERRHGAESRASLPRRGGRKSDGKTHGVPSPGDRRASDRPRLSGRSSEPKVGDAAPVARRSSKRASPSKSGDEAPRQPDQGSQRSGQGISPCQRRKARNSARLRGP
jgi:hypothetical protein